MAAPVMDFLSCWRAAVVEREGLFHASSLLVFKQACCSMHYLNSMYEVFFWQLAFPSVQAIGKRPAGNGWVYYIQRLCALAIDSGLLLLHYVIASCG